MAEYQRKLLDSERAVKAKDVELQVWKDEVHNQEVKYEALLRLHEETEEVRREFYSYQAGRATIVRQKN